MIRTAGVGVLHLISPSSLRSWFEHFVTLGEHDRIEWLGEEQSLPPAIVENLDRWHADAGFTVIHSSHDALLRDTDLALWLRSIKPTLCAQTRLAAMLGTDKVAMKSAFDADAIPTSAWAHLPFPAAVAQVDWIGEGPYVVKRRNGTEGKSTRLQRALAEPVPLSEEFVEPYIDGIEYSVVVYSSGSRQVTFPTVWKGSTSTDLTPPYRRLRLCPAPNLTADEDLAMRELSLRATRAMHSEGFAEVELILSDDGRLQIVEVNPRIAGTLRMSAMAARIKAFDLPFDGVDGHLPAQSCAAEIPCDGAAWSDPDQQIFCTSRLTAAASDWHELTDKMQLAASYGARLPAQWSTPGARLDEFALTTR